MPRMKVRRQLENSGLQRMTSSIVTETGTPPHKVVALSEFMTNKSHGTRVYCILKYIIQLYMQHST